MKALVVLALALAPLAAAADPMTAIPPRARALAERGRALHQTGDYAGAIAAFTEAYALAPSRALLFNLAQAFRLAGRCDDAAVMYRRYLAADPEPDARALAASHLAAIDHCAAVVAVAPPEAPPLAARATSEPDHAVVERPRRERDVGIGVAVGSGVALVTALYYTVEAHDAATAVTAAYAHGSGDAIHSLDARGRHDALMGKLCGALGIAGIGAGALLYYLGDRERAITVAPNTHGAEVAIRWRF